MDGELPLEMWYRILNYIGPGDYYRILRHDGVNHSHPMIYAIILQIEKRIDVCVNLYLKAFDVLCREFAKVYYSNSVDVMLFDHKLIRDYLMDEWKQCIIDNESFVNICAFSRPQQQHLQRGNGSMSQKYLLFCSSMFNHMFTQLQRYWKLDQMFTNGNVENFTIKKCDPHLHQNIKYLNTTHPNNNRCSESDITMTVQISRKYRIVVYMKVNFTNWLQTHMTTASKFRDANEYGWETCHKMRCLYIQTDTQELVSDNGNMWTFETSEAYKHRRFRPVQLGIHKIFLKYFAKIFYCMLGYEDSTHENLNHPWRKHL